MEKSVKIYSEDEKIEIIGDLNHCYNFMISKISKSLKKIDYKAIKSIRENEIFNTSVGTLSMWLNQLAEIADGVQSLVDENFNKQEGEK